MSSDEAPGPAAVVEGDVVQLRLATADDVDALAAIRRHPAVFEHWRGGTDMVAAVHEDMAEEGSTGYAIELDGRVAGWIQYAEELEPDYRCASIDVYVDAAVHGRGVGTDAVRTMALHLCRDRGHHRVTIDPAAHNEAAIRCYTKVGFRPIGVTRRSERGNDGTWHDGLMMDLLAEELG